MQWHVTKSPWQSKADKACGLSAARPGTPITLLRKEPRSETIRYLSLSPHPYLHRCAPRERPRAATTLVPDSAHGLIQYKQHLSDSNTALSTQLGQQQHVAGQSSPGRSADRLHAARLKTSRPAASVARQAPHSRLHMQPRLALASKQVHTSHTPPAHTPRRGHHVCA